MDGQLFPRMDEITLDEILRDISDSMTKAAQRHLELENQLLLGRISDILSEADEDALLEEMGDIWWDMTDDERERADHRARRENETEK